MFIIGERINSSRKRIAEAIAAKDTAFIQKEAMVQANAGAHYLDINCATSLKNELADLEWLIQTIRKATDLPFSLDSPNPLALEKGLSLLKGEDVFINSITLEKDRLEAILPLVKKYQAKVIALTMDKNGVPRTKEKRIEIAKKILKRLEDFQVSKHLIYFDLLVQPLSTQSEQAKVFLQALQEIKDLGLNTVCGLSNVSFGLPRRSLINSAFLACAMAFGIDAALIDPTDEEIQNTLLAMNVILNKDNYCLNYIKAMKKRQ